MRICSALIVVLFIMVASVAGAMGPAVAEDEPMPIEPQNPVEQSADDLLTDLQREFGEAVQSLDATNESLGNAVEMKNFQGALSVVDRLTDKMNALADRVRPGNDTQVRAQQIIKDIDELMEEIRTNDGLSPEFKRPRLERLGAYRERIADGEQELASFYPTLTEFAEELKRKRREVAYDVIISAYANAADSLEQTNARIRELIGKLRGYLDQIKEPPTQ